MITRSVSALPTGTALSRLLELQVKSHGNVRTALSLVDGDDYRNVPAVRAVLEDYQRKALVAPGTSTDATWASALVAAGIDGEVLSLLRDVSVVAAIAPRCRREPFNTKVPKENSAAALGGWVLEGAPAPVAALSFSTVGPIPANKVAVIVVQTRELVIATDPASQLSVRRSVLGGLACKIDQLFLDPTVVAAPPLPGSITAGATAITSTGTTAAQISADLAAMRAAITTNGSGLTWIMRKKTMGTIAGALGSTSGLPQTLHGFPVITSDNSPAQVTLADGAAILIADDGQFAVDASQSATLQMDSAPMSPPDATVVMRSLFQHNEVGIRAVRWISWLRPVATSVSYMTVAY